MTKIKQLSSGIRMIIDHIPQVQSVSIGIWVGTGASKETKEYAGISHFTEHMMFKGTKKRNALEIARAIDEVGGQFDAFTGKEATCYYVKTMKDGVLTAADVLTDMLTNSLFDETEMNRERKVIKEEIKMANDTPEDVVIERAQEIIDKGNPMANSILGTPTSIGRINPDVMRNYVKDTYTKDQIIISVSGNFDEDSLTDFLDNKLSKFKSKQKAPGVWTEGKTYKPGFKSVIKDIEQAHICLATKGIPMTHKNYYSLLVLNNAFGGSMSSRLFQNIREKKGLAYSVSSHNSSSTRTGYFAIYAGVGHDNIKLAIDAIKEELSLLPTIGLDEKEIEKSKKQLMSSYVFSMESTMSRMLRNGRNLLLQGRIYEPKEILNKFEKVSRKEIDEAIHIISDIDNYSACICSDKEIDVKGLIK